MGASPSRLSNTFPPDLLMTKMSYCYVESLGLFLDWGEMLINLRSSPLSHKGSGTPIAPKRVNLK